jgi:MFS family permease
VESRNAWFPVALTGLVLAWGGNHFTPLLLVYRERYGYSEFDATIFFAIYAIGVIPGILAAGPISDRYGRKPVLLVGVIAGIVGSAVIGFGSSNARAIDVGRLVVGGSVAIAMTVATTWIKELSSAVPAATAARRASVALTIGGAGTVVSGALAQWGPRPLLTPYVVQGLLALIAGAMAVFTPETRQRSTAPGPGFRNLVPARPHRRRFLLVVLPGALWVFTANALAVVVGPSLAAERLGDRKVAYATLMTVLMIGSGVLFQRALGWAIRVTRGRPLIAGLGLIQAGLLALMLASAADIVWPTALAAVLLGAGYGITIISGLIEVQAMADPKHLGGLTSAYYAITFTGFGVPAALAAFTEVVPTSLLLLAMALVCGACSLVAAIASVHLPRVDPDVRVGSQLKASA